ncbi:type II toxin-antitoxin system RelE family toxin [Acetobacter oryzifermentans]|uniref:type II toxin-antitoxin system RelE family toxin n=1 Tax=Acetobacter oryzifermentans TaxID=1633874 RepID=UPI0039BFBDE3
MPEYIIRFDPDALDEWDALDGSIRKLFEKFLTKLVINPFILGRRLNKDLDGCFKIKLRSQGYRIIYEVIENIITIYIWAVGKREDNAIYTTASQRIAHQRQIEASEP